MDIFFNSDKWQLNAVESLQYAESSVYSYRTQ